MKGMGAVAALRNDVTEWQESQISYPAGIEKWL